MALLGRKEGAALLWALTIALSEEGSPDWVAHVEAAELPFGQGFFPGHGTWGPRSGRVEPARLTDEGVAMFSKMARGPKAQGDQALAKIVRMQAEALGALREGVSAPGHFGFVVEMVGGGVAQVGLDVGRFGEVDFDEGARLFEAPALARSAEGGGDFASMRIRFRVEGAGGMALTPKELRVEFERAAKRGFGASVGDGGGA